MAQSAILGFGLAPQIKGLGGGVERKWQGVGVKKEHAGKSKGLRVPLHRGPPALRYAPPNQKPLAPQQTGGAGGYPNPYPPYPYNPHQQIYPNAGYPPQQPYPNVGYPSQQIYPNVGYSPQQLYPQQTYPLQQPNPQQYNYPPQQPNPPQYNYPPQQPSPRSKWTFIADLLSILVNVPDIIDAVPDISDAF